jgi:hypothetical protein
LTRSDKIREVFERLADFVGHAILRKPSKAAATKAFAEIIGRCPICNGPLTSSHRFWVLAMAVPGSQAAHTIETHLRLRAWSLARLDEWDAEKDSIQITMICCPHSSNVAMLRSCHPSSMLSLSHVETAEQLNEVESQEVRRLADDDWTSF